MYVKPTSPSENKFSTKLKEGASFFSFCPFIFVVPVATPGSIKSRIGDLIKSAFWNSFPSTSPSFLSFFFPSKRIYPRDSLPVPIFDNFFFFSPYVQYLIFPHLVGPQHGWRMEKNRASRITRNKEIISFILGRRPLLREIDLECCRYSRKDRDSISLWLFWYCSGRCNKNGNVLTF